MTATVDFEALYRRDPDPWGYTTSAYERDKYAATLKACGDGPFACALELGGSIGVFSELLAPRCQSLITIDAAPTAVAQARHRLAGRANVRIVEGEIPQAIPRDRYDLMVASEVLYYLQPDQFEQTLAALERTLADHGRLVAVHWRRHGPERPLTADQVHQALRRQPWLAAAEDDGTGDYRLDVLERI